MYLKISMKFLIMIQLLEIIGLLIDMFTKSKQNTYLMMQELNH